MGYWYLVLAIIFEVVGTTTLNVSQGFTRLWPSVVTVAGYSVSFYFLALTLRSVPMAIAYAVWGGAGIVLIALVDIVFFKQVPDFPAVLGMLLIVIGVVLVTAVSRVAGH